MDKLWEKVRKNFIPTSTEQQLKSLQNLLGHFCKSDVVYKTAKLSNGYLNYVEVVRKNVNGSILSNPNPNSNPKPNPNPNERPKRTLLLMHGFGSGLGFFFNNYDDLALHFDRVISVDWLGMGASSRSFNNIQPRLTVYDQMKSLTMSKSDSSEQLSTGAAVDFFVDSLEEMVWNK
jgi:pimeloyl-ACP methyl ester carboxylesterase